MSLVGLTGGAARRVFEVPALRTFVERIHAPSLAEDPESFWECAPAFKALLETSFLTETLNYEFQTIVADGSYLPVGASTDVSFTVASTTTWSLSARLLRAPPTIPRLMSSAEHTMIGLPKCGRSAPLILDDYERVTAEDDSGSAERRLRSRGRINVCPGQILFRRAAVDVSRFIYGGSPALAFVLSSRLIMPLRWEYDIETLTPRRVIAGDVRSSRIEFATKLLAELGNASSLPQLWSLRLHKDHFVRWGAIRAIVAIDVHEGLKALNEATFDAHPHVAAAARASIPRVLAVVTRAQDTAEGATLK